MVTIIVISSYFLSYAINLFFLQILQGPTRKILTNSLPSLFFQLKATNYSTDKMFETEKSIIVFVLFLFILTFKKK